MCGAACAPGILIMLPLSNNLVDMRRWRGALKLIFSFNYLLGSVCTVLVLAGISCRYNWQDASCYWALMSEEHSILENWVNHKKMSMKVFICSSYFIKTFNIFYILTLYKIWRRPWKWCESCLCSPRLLTKLPIVWGQTIQYSDSKYLNTHE